MVGTKTRLITNRIRSFVHDSRDDRELLERFHTQSDSDAFDTLVHRYGPMVMGICRRAIRDPHRAEDAFQATFLVLLKKSRTIRNSAVGPWLSGVARKVSLACLSRMPREQTVSQLPDQYARSDSRIDRDVLSLLDRELNRLPQIHRDAVILCELQGLSRSEAARILGIAEGTLSSRLAIARKTLASRLIRRGVAISSAGLGMLWSHRAMALAPSLISQTLHGVGANPVVASLARGVMATMTPFQLITTKTTTLAFCLFVGIGLVSASDPATPVASSATATTNTNVKNGNPLTSDRTRFVVLMDQDVRYFKPNGSIDQFITYQDALKLEPEMFSGSISFPGGVSRFLNSVGRPGPGGFIPLETKAGVKKLTPGTHVTVHEYENLISERVRPWITCWSHDGCRYLSTESSGEILTGITAYRTTISNLATGEIHPLRLPPECEVVDWSESTNRVVALKHKKQRGIFGTSYLPSSSLCLLTTDGKLIAELEREDAFFPHEIRFSPDGKSVAYFGKSEENADAHWVLKCMELDTKTVNVLSELRSERVGKNANTFRMMNKIAWSPDSTHVALLHVWASEKSKGVFEMKSMKFDRAGHDCGSVSLGQTPHHNHVRFFEWLNVPAGQ